MSAAQSQVGRARLLTVASPHSGDFVNTIRCSYPASTTLRNIKET